MVAIYRFHSTKFFRCSARPYDVETLYLLKQAPGSIYLIYAAFMAREPETDRSNILRHARFNGLLIETKIIQRNVGFDMMRILCINRAGVLLNLDTLTHCLFSSIPQSRDVDINYIPWNTQTRCWWVSFCCGHIISPLPFISPINTFPPVLLHRHWSNCMIAPVPVSSPHRTVAKWTCIFPQQSAKRVHNSS